MSDYTIFWDIFYERNNLDPVGDLKKFGLIQKIGIVHVEFKKAELAVKANPQNTSIRGSITRLLYSLSSDRRSALAFGGSPYLPGEAHRFSGGHL
jgi:hypothetical protein